MRRSLFAICLLFLASCGGGGSAPLTLDGTWDATSLVVGSSMTLVLTEQSAKVAGPGSYSIAAGPKGILVVAGEHTGGVVALVIGFDNSPQATYTGAMQDATHMTGLLAYQGGSTSKVDFVRR
jgi:hypothetical protein